MSDKITRDAVLGWVVIQRKRQGDSGGVIAVEPLAINWEGFLDDTDADLEIEPSDERIVVIPAMPGTFQVWGDTGQGCKVLGYEIPGAFIPDWNEVLTGLTAKH